MPRRVSVPVQINRIQISSPRSSLRLQRTTPRRSGSGSSKGSPSSSSSSPEMTRSASVTSLPETLHTSSTFSDLRQVIMADSEADEEDEGSWFSWQQRQRRLAGSTDSSPRMSPRNSYCDFSSIAEDDEDAKFHVRFFNKFGRKGTEEEAFKDASCVSHVYKDSVLVTDTLNNKVVLFKRSGRPKRAFMLDEGCEPCAAAVTPRGYVATTVRRHACVTVWSGRGVTMNEFGSDVLRSPADLAVDNLGRYIVADEGANKVFVFSPTGELMASLGEGDPDVGAFKQPRYVCCSASGRIVVSDSGNHCIKIFDSSCKFLFRFGKFGTKDGEFKFPYGVCTDQAENIVVADYFNDRVSLFSPEGVFVQQLVTSQRGLKRPRSVSMRCAHNRKLFITHGGMRSTEVMVYKLVPQGSRYSVGIKGDV